MRLAVLMVACATLGSGTAAADQPAPTTPPSGASATGPEYIFNPEWVAQVPQSQVDLYRPVDAPSGGAIVDCAAKADGGLVDCKAVEVKPKGSNYEFAGPLAVGRLYRLKPTLPDGRSVEGKRVLVTVLWR